jgi:uncharacterized membrane protein (UPF0127 family)
MKLLHRTFFIYLIMFCVLVAAIFTFSLFKNGAKAPNNSSNIVKMNFSKLEVARTESEKEIGLMNRTELCNTCGMLFLWDEPSVLSFWMKNTFVSIDIIYLDDNNIIRTLIKNPKLNNTELSYSSEVEVRRVLEIPTNRSTELGLKVGTKLEFDY